MHVGYVSDEHYVALSGVDIEFERRGELVTTARSTATGRINASIEPGRYVITLRKKGYTPSQQALDIDGEHRVQFRLMPRELLGYASPIAVRSGEQGTYHINAPEETQVSLWRYGERKERIRLLDWHGEHGPGATAQMLPTGDIAQHGVDWRSKNPSSAVHRETLRAPGRSGLYYIHLRAKRSGAFFSFPWVVAPAAPNERLAVLASTMTWNAYNNFGGRSNYVAPDALPERPIVDPHKELRRYRPGEGPYDPPNDAYRPLSYRRPSRQLHVPEEVRATDPVAGRNESHLAPAEWRFLAWLEREGFGYDLYADDQLHDATLDLDAYDTLLIHTHPEYWTREMYDRVKNWVHDRGGNLVYFGGNGINCAVEVVDEHRLRYLTHDGDVTNSGGRAGPGDESRFDAVHESEANLLGVVYTETGIMSAAPYEVIDDTHWAVADTGLAAGDRFGMETLQERCAGGASGHETDKRSEASPATTELIARGCNSDEGGAEMVSYDTDSGGEVFSVGSITFPLSLLVDEECSRVAKNVLDRFLTE